MATHTLDAHHEVTTHMPLLSSIADKVGENMPNSIKSIFARAKGRVEQVLSIPTQIREMIEKVKDGHPLSKTEWATIMATPGSFLIAGYYILKVTENTANNVIGEIKSQYHAMLDGLGLRKEATPDEFPEAVAKNEAAHAHGDLPKVDQDDTGHSVEKPQVHTAPVAHTGPAANDDHAHHHNVEHQGEHAKAA